MTIEHTPGKLRAAKASPSYDALIYENGEPVFDYTRDDDGLHFAPEDARRLCACWNACQNIPTESLEENGAAGYEQMVELAKANEVMMAALQSAKSLFSCVETCSRNNFVALAFEEIEAIDKAIAKIGGAA